MNPRHGWIDYHERMGRVTAYIHDHLAEPLELDRLAEVAHLSPFHWHRIYHALHGETITATVRRLRLHRATGYLANTAMEVRVIARKCGYPNSQSFARAFTATYGVSPSKYRDTGGHQVFNAASDEPFAAGYAVEVREVPEVELAGIDHRGSYMLIGKAFEKAYAQFAAHGLDRPSMRWMAVYLDDPFAVPEAQLCSRAGMSIPAATNVQAPLSSFSLGGCTCAVLRHRGPYATMRSAYRWLYGHWLMKTGHTVANAPVFEEYLNHPRDTAPGDLLTDIFLPLAKD